MMAKSNKTLLVPPLVLILSVLAGCGHVKSKRCCRVYQPHDYFLGDEAVRMGPCGPDEAYHGYKPTQWNYWPEDWNLYRGSALSGAEGNEFVIEDQPNAEPVPSGRSEPRNDRSRDVSPSMDGSADPSGQMRRDDSPLNRETPSVPPADLPSGDDLGSRTLPPPRSRTRTASHTGSPQTSLIITDRPQGPSRIGHDPSTFLYETDRVLTRRSPRPTKWRR